MAAFEERKGHPMTKRSAALSYGVVLVCTCVLVAIAILPAAGAGQTAHDQEIMRQARRAYYNLRKEGLVEFQCEMIPDWNAILAAQGAADASANQRAMRTLEQLRFRVFMGADDNVKVTHTVVDSSNSRETEGLQKIYGGMEQMVVGIYTTVSPFLLTSPFPTEETPFHLEEVDGAYRLAYKEGSADVETRMGKNYGVSELKVTTAEFTSSIWPTFLKNPKGLLVNGYRATYKGANAPGEIGLLVDMAYQEVSGLQLFQALKVTANVGGETSRINVQFAGCQVKTR
jgi:hypothetical protein